jgi:outer membrane receptor for ferrienterochelin and colicin
MGGVRADNNSQYGFSINPRLAGMFILSPKLSFRGSIGYAYKAPPASLEWQSLAYRAGANLDSLIYIAIPNRDLKPEKYMSVELGVLKKFKRGMNINVSVFYNEIKNLIVDMNVPVDDLDLPLAIKTSDTATVLMRINSSSSVSRLYGFQSTIKRNDIIKSIHLNLELSLTFTISSQKLPDFVKLASDYVSNFKLNPAHLGQLKISAQPLKNFYIQLTNIWESSWLRVVMPVKEIYNKVVKDFDGFYCMDLVANYKFGTNLNGFIKVNNILDEKYGGPVYSGMRTSLPYDPQTGRSIQFGLTYTLN